MRTITIDYHMHTTLSPDGGNTMKEMCQRAVDIGLLEIALTDHFEIFTPDFQPNKRDPIEKFTLAMFDTYQKQLQECRKVFAGRLVIKAGLELGQSHINPSRARQVLSQMPFDYILGSMHKIDNQDFYWTDYHAVDLVALQKRNLRELYCMVDTADFDCVGHIDLIRRYAVREGYDLSIMHHKKEVQKILARLIEREKGLELNTSGLRQPVGEIIPNLEILQLYRHLGGRIITFGSDAHNVSDLGEGLEEAYTLAKQAGFTRGTRYTNRTPSFYDLP